MFLQLLHTKKKKNNNNDNKKKSNTVESTSILPLNTFFISFFFFFTFTQLFLEIFVTWISRCNCNVVEYLMTFLINVSQSKRSHLLSRSHHHETPGSNIRDISSHDQQKTDENDNFVFSRIVCIIQLKLRSLKAFSNSGLSRWCTHTINTNFLPIIIVCFQNEMGIVFVDRIYF